MRLQCRQGRAAAVDRIEMPVDRVAEGQPLIAEQIEVPA